MSAHTAAAAAPDTLAAPALDHAFTLIQRNDYSLFSSKEMKKLTKINREDVSHCKCDTAGHDCSDEACVNRAMKEECIYVCHGGTTCRNQRIQGNQRAPIEVFDAGDKGRGLRALEALGRDTFILEYVGDVVNERQLKRRLRQYRKEGRRHRYIMELDKKKRLYVDSTKKANISRYMNHCCEPNCYVEVWHCGGENRAAFFTLKPVAKGEELVFDYHWEALGETSLIECQCGTAKCHGFVDYVPHREGWDGWGDDNEEDGNSEDDAAEEAAEAAAVAASKSSRKKSSRRSSGTSAADDDSLEPANKRMRSLAPQPPPRPLTPARVFSPFLQIRGLPNVESLGAFEAYLDRMALNSALVRGTSYFERTLQTRGPPKRSLIVVLEFQSQTGAEMVFPSLAGQEVLKGRFKLFVTKLVIDHKDTRPVEGEQEFYSRANRSSPPVSTTKDGGSLVALASATRIDEELANLRFPFFVNWGATKAPGGGGVATGPSTFQRKNLWNRMKRYAQKTRQPLSVLSSAMICCHRFFAVQRFSDFDSEKLNYVIAAALLVASKSAGECSASGQADKLTTRLARILSSERRKLALSQSVNEAIAAAHHTVNEQSNLEDMLMQDRDEDDFEDDSDDDFEDDEDADRGTADNGKLDTGTSDAKDAGEAGNEDDNSGVARDSSVGDGANSTATDGEVNLLYRYEQGLLVTLLFDIPGGDFDPWSPRCAIRALCPTVLSGLTKVDHGQVCQHAQQLAHICLDADIWVQLPVEHVSLCFVVAVTAILIVSKKLSITEIVPSEEWFHLPTWAKDCAITRSVIRPLIFGSPSDNRGARATTLFRKLHTVAEEALPNAKRQLVEQAQVVFDQCWAMSGSLSGASGASSVSGASGVSGTTGTASTAGAPSASSAIGAAEDPAKMQAALVTDARLGVNAKPGSRSRARSTFNLFPYDLNGSDFKLIDQKDAASSSSSAAASTWHTKVGKCALVNSNAKDRVCAQPWAVVGHTGNSRSHARATGKALYSGFPALALAELQVLRALWKPERPKSIWLPTDLKVGHEWPQERWQASDSSNMLSIDPIWFIGPPLRMRLKRMLEDRKLLQSIKPRAFFHDILSAIKHCHSSRIMQGSISPSNIFISHSGRAVLSGFAKSSFFRKSDIEKRKERALRSKHKRSSGAAARTNSVKPGRLVYMPAEHILGSDLLTPEAEMWTVGAITAHVMMGKPLVQAEGRREFIKRMFQMCGSEKLSSRIKILPFYEKTTKPYPRCVEEKLLKYTMKRQQPAEGPTLMSTRDVEALTRDVCSLLEIDPKKRATATNLLAAQPARSRTKAPFVRKKKSSSSFSSSSSASGSATSSSASRKSTRPLSSSKAPNSAPPRPPPAPPLGRPLSRALPGVPPSDKRSGGRVRTSQYPDSDRRRSHGHPHSRGRSRSRSRSRSRGRNRSPPRGMRRDPPRDRDRHRSPPRSMGSNPPRDRVRNRSTSRDRGRNRSPPRERRRHRSPPRSRGRSPPRGPPRGPPPPRDHREFRGQNKMS
jgi:serine/threonine protein kinase